MSVVLDSRLPRIPEVDPNLEAKLGEIDDEGFLWSRNYLDEIIVTWRKKNGELESKVKFPPREGVRRVQAGID
jgi:hypothetical protein